MKRQRGVALIIALLVVALSSLLVVALLDAGELTQARVRNGWRAEQSLQLSRGLEAWATAGLLADLRQTGAVDAPGEQWAQPMPAITLPDARIEGRLRDLGGCFNINSIAPNGHSDPLAMQRLSRLVKALRLPDRLATRLADYVDADRTTAQGSAEGGGSSESGNAGGPLMDASELLHMPGMTASEWRSLSGLLCATPVDQPINLNTAPPAIWQALSNAIDPEMAQRLARTGVNPYSDITAVQAALQREGVTGVDLSGCGVGSRYFMAEARIVLDDITFRRSMVLQRSPDRIRVIARMRGAPSHEVRP